MSIPRSKNVYIDFCNKLLELKKALFNNEPELMRKSLKSGMIKLSKPHDFNIKDDAEYKALQDKYDQIINSFLYTDKNILMKIASDLSGDLNYNKAELLVDEEFQQINALFIAYVNSDVFKKKIALYEPSNVKIKQILELIKSEKPPETYNKHLLSMLLFLHFEKKDDDNVTEQKFIKGSEYYIECYGKIDDGIYRSSGAIDVARQLKSKLESQLIEGYPINTIIQILYDLVMFYKLTPEDNYELRLLVRILEHLNNITNDDIESFSDTIIEYISTTFGDENINNFVQFLHQIIFIIKGQIPYDNNELLTSGSEKLTQIYRVLGGHENTGPNS